MAAAALSSSPTAWLTKSDVYLSAHAEPVFREAPLDCPDRVLSVQYDVPTFLDRRADDHAAVAAHFIPSLDNELGRNLTDNDPIDVYDREGSSLGGDLTENSAVGPLWVGNGGGVAAAPKLDGADDRSFVVGAAVDIKPDLAEEDIGDPARSGGGACRTGLRRRPCAAHH